MADYLNMDATLVRILTVLISLFTGVPVILYIIALFVVPGGHHRADRAAAGHRGVDVPGSVLRRRRPSTPPPAYAPYPGAERRRDPSDAEEAVWGSEGPPWEQRQPETTAPPRPLPRAAAPTPEPVAPSEPEAPVVPPEDDRGHRGLSRRPDCPLRPHNWSPWRPVVRT